jgi:hypothetical protein
MAVASIADYNKDFIGLGQTEVFEQFQFVSGGQCDSFVFVPIIDSFRPLLECSIWLCFVYPKRLIEQMVCCKFTILESTLMRDQSIVTGCSSDRLTAHPGERRYAIRNGSSQCSVDQSIEPVVVLVQYCSFGNPIRLIKRSKA